MRTHRLRSAWAVALTVALALTYSFTPLMAGGNADFSGRVYQPDGVAVRADVVVILLDIDRGKEFRSAPTTEDGAFRITSAPAGSYTVVIESPEGAFLAADSLELASGANRPLALRLDASAKGPRSLPGLAQTSSNSGMATWAKWIIVGGIGIASVIVINEVTDDDDPPSSPFGGN
jgi:hypothetical protein